MWIAVDGQTNTASAVEFSLLTGVTTRSASWPQIQPYTLASQSIIIVWQETPGEI